MFFAFLKKIFIFLFSILQSIFIIFIYLFSGFKSKKKNLWCFGSLAGKEFRGNTKYLFKYLEKNHKEIEIFWIAKSRSLNLKLRKKGINSIYAYDLEGFKKISSASLFFCTHGFVDLVLALTRKAKIIMLGHMTCTIKNNSKKILMEKKNFLNKIYEFIKTSYFYIRKINYGVYSSNFSKENLITEDKWFPENKLILGLPKSDYLLSIKNSSKKNDFSIKKSIENEKIILFLPTRRNDKFFHIFNYGFTKKKIEEFAKTNNCKFFISLHPTNVNNNIPNFTSNKIHMINFDGNSIDNALISADLLITDYGSIFADYLIFDKPMIFTKFDHLKYTDDNGLKIDYESLPGPKVNDWNELLFQISELLYNKDSFIKDREKWKSDLYKFNDGKNCERIVNHFKELQKI